MSKSKPSGGKRSEFWNLRRWPNGLYVLALALAVSAQGQKWQCENEAAAEAAAQTERERVQMCGELSDVYHERVAVLRVVREQCKEIIVNVCGSDDPGTAMLCEEIVSSCTAIEEGAVEASLKALRANACSVLIDEDEVEEIMGRLSAEDESDID